MKRFDGSEFQARRERCNQVTRNVLDFLRTVAEHAGADVERPTFEVRGVGVTYWVAGKRFCRFDPKHQAGHVWVLVPGGDRVVLEGAGRVSEREDGPWVTIKDMRGAVRLVPEILRGHDAAVFEALTRDAAGSRDPAR